MIPAGELNEVISVYSRMVEVNQYGEQTESWSLLMTTRAKVQHDSGRKQLTTSDEIIYVYTKSFIVRYYHAITEDMRIQYNDRMWQILSVDADPERMQLTIRAEIINE